MNRFTHSSRVILRDAARLFEGNRKRVMAIAAVMLATTLLFQNAVTTTAQVPSPTATPAGTAIPTKGTAAIGSGGAATVAFFGDLKKFACTPSPANVLTCKQDPHSLLYYEVRATDYDDEPGGNPGTSTFYVSPNLDDNPLQHAWKFVFIDFNGTNDVTEIQKTLKWCAPGAVGAAGVADAPLGTLPSDPANPTEPGGPDCRTVWHERVDTSTQELRNREILTGVACSNFLGLSTAENQPAHGLITTGQLGAEILNEYRTDCIQAGIGLHPNNFTISKHLPPGPYQQCVTLHYISGGQAAPLCKTIIVNAVNGFKVDFNQVTWPSLVMNFESKAHGDWVFDAAGNSLFPSIEGTGNTSLVLSGVFSKLVNNAGTPGDTGDDKEITSEFDVQINRRGPTGPPFTLAEYELASGILAGATWILDGPSTPIPPRLTSGAVCLEPNEILKLDFSVTPRQGVSAGTYTGTVTLTAAPDTTAPIACAPSLDTGESSTGDLNPYDNNPSQTPP